MNNHIYLSFKGLEDERFAVRSFFPDWKALVQVKAGFHYYENRQHERRTVEDWMGQMVTYLFAPVTVRFVKGQEEETVTIPQLTVPALCEAQAKALADLACRSYTGISCNDGREMDLFKGYETPLRMVGTRLPVRPGDFHRDPDAYDGKKGSYDDFLLDFAIKYGFDRRLRSVGSTVQYIEGRTSMNRPYLNEHHLPYV